jgi:hypothetical protein
MSSFTENLYLKRMIRQLQEENKQLRNILEAAPQSAEPVEQLAPEVPSVLPVGIKPSLTSPGAKPFRIPTPRLPKIPPGVGGFLGYFYYLLALGIAFDMAYQMAQQAFPNDIPENPVDIITTPELFTPEALKRATPPGSISPMSAPVGY